MISRGLQETVTDFTILPFAIIAKVQYPTLSGVHVKLSEINFTELSVSEPLRTIIFDWSRDEPSETTKATGPEEDAYHASTVVELP